MQPAGQPTQPEPGQPASRPVRPGPPLAEPQPVAVPPEPAETPDEEFLRRATAAYPHLRRAVSGGRPLSPGKELKALAQEAAGLGEHQWDRYGTGGPVAELEATVAETLGTPAALMFPSGVMAQQAALAVWAQRYGCHAVALPGLSHLLVHEEDGPALLHGFRWARLTEGPVVPVAADLGRVPGRLGAVLLELPLRDGGHLLPSWEELVAFSDACRDRGVPLHLDGARLWESAAALGRTPQQVAALADSVYVSLYKGLGGIGGAVLAGPADVLAEAAVWRRRHGGTLFSMAPYALAGLRGLRQQLPRMAEYRERALDLAAALVDRGVTVHPDPPHTNAFRVMAPGALAQFDARLLRCLEEDRTFALPRMRRSDVPGWCWTELTVGPATMDWDTVKAADYLAHVLLGD